MSLKQVARRFAEDEGNVYSMYEECLPIVQSFFNKLQSIMKDEEYKFAGNITLPLPPTTEDLHTDQHQTLLKIFIIAVQHMILYKKCDLDCLDYSTWEYLRNALRNESLIYR